MGERVLVALGGNAILKHKEKGTAEEQVENVQETCRYLVDLIKEGYQIAITHGNGPQVGDILLKNELSKKTLPPMPLDICGAESQGMIGYMLQLSMLGQLLKAGLSMPVVTILTMTRVDSNDPAFKNPQKPIGPFYTAMQASELREEKGWTIVDDSGRGCRRVVPSPIPTDILEKDSIVTLVHSGAVVIACGGGGIPVTISDQGIPPPRGVEAVIDKDHAAALFATLIDADILLILTDVEKVSLNFGKPNQKDLTDMTVKEAQKYYQEGQFAPGSMGPKIESTIQFIERGGKRAVITSIHQAKNALKGKGGTVIHS
ncbi:MAG: carbamate kinase [Theionarchaea archaeon]|nr:carbamate kinase [Theionarchaea archaeon]